MPIHVHLADVFLVGIAHVERRRHEIEGALHLNEDIAGGIEDGCCEGPVRAGHLPQDRAALRRVLLGHVPDDLAVAVEERVVVGLLEAHEQVCQLQPSLHREVGLRQKRLEARAARSV